MNVLEIKDLHVEIEGKEIIKGITLKLVLLWDLLPQPFLQKIDYP